MVKPEMLRIKLCFKPKPFAGIDWEWIKKSQPSDGWHYVLGNNIARLQFVKSMRGESLLSSPDKYEDSCFRAKVLHAEDPKDGVSGQFFGQRNFISNWNCNNSLDFPGLLLCEITSTTTKQHVYYNYYITFSDNKNIQIGISCFPNGQVGWTVHSITKSLTKSEKKTITDHIASIGFSEDTIVVTLYDERKCSNE